MNGINTYNQFVNESVRDSMKPKPDKDIRRLIKEMRLNPNEKMRKAIELGLVWLAEEAIKQKLNLNKNTKGGDSIKTIFVIRAIRKGNFEILNLLLHNGCQLESKFLNRYLHEAVTNNQAEMTKFLITRGAKFNFKGDENPIKIAINNNNLELLKIILDSKDIKKEFDIEWFEKLMLAERINSEIIKLLVNKIPRAKAMVEGIIDHHEKRLIILKKCI